MIATAAPDCRVGIIGRQRGRDTPGWKVWPFLPTLLVAILLLHFGRDEGVAC